MYASKAMVAAIAIVAASAVADAQTCMGLAPFSAGRVQVGASGEFAKDSKAFSGSLSVGSRSAAFGGVSVGTISYEDFDGNTTAVGGQLGWQIPIAAGGRVQLCPGGGALFGLGPDNIGGSGADFSSWTAFFGLQFGIAAGTSPQLSIIPTAGAAIAHTKVEIDGGFFGDLENDDIYGVLSLGVGFVLSSRVSILPSVALPVGLDDPDPSFGIMVAVNFARGS